MNASQKRKSEYRKMRAAFESLDWPVPTPQSFHHWTLARQVDHLVTAREAEPDLGFMARMLALCSLPRTNPGRRKEYVRRNGPYTLVMSAGGLNKLPYGNLPRLLLAWVSTEAVRTRRRTLVLGNSLSEFMRRMDIYSDSGGSRGMRTRLRNQMHRLFNVSIQLLYEDDRHSASMSSFVADRTDFWWNPKRPDDPVLWDSTIRLGEGFFQEIIRYSIPLDMNILRALKRSPLGLDLYMWLAYRTFTLKKVTAIRWRRPLPPVRGAPLEGGRPLRCEGLPKGLPPGDEEDQGRLAGTAIWDGPRRAHYLALEAAAPARRPVDRAHFSTTRRTFPR